MHLAWRRGWRGRQTQKPAHRAQRRRRVAAQTFGGQHQKLLTREQPQHPFHLRAIEAPLDIRELPVMAPGVGVEQPLATLADTPGEGFSLGPPRILHAPMRPRPLHGIAQHQDQLHGRVVGADALQAVGPVAVDRRRLAARPAIGRREMGVVIAIVRGRPVAGVVVEEMEFLVVRPRHVRVVAQVVEQRRGAALLGAGDQEIDAGRAGHGLTSRDGVRGASLPASASPRKRLWKAIGTGRATGFDDEDGDPGGRARHAHLGREPPPAQADDRGRRAADPVAHHEAVFALRFQRLRGLPGVPGLCDQGVFRQLCAAQRRPDRGPGQGRHRVPRHPPRALARDPGGDRRGDHDRGTVEARRALSEPRRTVLSDLWRRGGGSGHRQAGGFPQGARQGRHAHRRHPARPLWRTRDRGRSGAAVHREAARRQRPDQRRLLCAEPHGDLAHHR